MLESRVVVLLVCMRSPEAAHADPDAQVLFGIVSLGDDEAIACMLGPHQ